MQELGWGRWLVTLAFQLEGFKVKLPVTVRPPGKTKKKLMPNDGTQVTRQVTVEQRN